MVQFCLNCDIPTVLNSCVYFLSSIFLFYLAAGVALAQRGCPSRWQYVFDKFKRFFIYFSFKADGSVAPVVPTCPSTPAFVPVPSSLIQQSLVQQMGPISPGLILLLNYALCAVSCRNIPPQGRYKHSEFNKYYSSLYCENIDAGFSNRSSTFQNSSSIHQICLYFICSVFHWLDNILVFI